MENEHTRLPPLLYASVLSEQAKSIIRIEMEERQVLKGELDV